MSAVSGVSAASLDIVNQVLAKSGEAQMKLADKLMKYAVEMSVLAGKEAGKGQALDMIA